MSAVALSPSTGVRSQRQTLMRTLSRIAPMVVILILAAIYLTPFVWMVSTSLKTQAQSIASPPVLVPGPITVDAFPQAFVRMDFLRGLANTLIYAVPSVIGTVVVVQPGGLRVRARQLAGPQRRVRDHAHHDDAAEPGDADPALRHLRQAGLDQHVPAARRPDLPRDVPFFIFLLRQFFMGIPRELLDAARLDGASELRILTRIVAPLAAPALITVALLTFIDKWNDFYGPLLYLQKPELRPLSLSIQVFQSAHRTDWPQIDGRVGPRRARRSCSSTSSPSASSSRESPSPA